MPSKAAIIIVNWNSWEDTSRCLTACTHLKDFHGPILVLDNNSTDGSISKLKDWASRRSPPTADTNADEILNLTQRNIKENWDFIFLDSESINEAKLQDERIHIISLSRNLGFAGANNAGIKIAAKIESIQFFWLLNPDAVPEHNALATLLEDIGSDASPVVAGSVLLEYWSPHTIQAVGAQFNFRLFVASHRYEGLPVETLSNLPSKQTVSYPVGASLILNRPYIDKLGLLEEAYFLYFEEIDISHRAPASSIFVSTRSIVYHKGGTSTNSGKTLKYRKWQSDYYYNRGRILFARKVGIQSTCTAIVATIYSVFKRIANGRIDLCSAALRGLLDGLRFPSKSFTEPKI